MKLISVAAVAMVLTCVGCGDDDGAAPKATEADGPAPTVCLPGVTDDSKSVILKIDDLVSGFGSIGSRSPSPKAGPVRIEVRADAENRGPATVTLHRDTAEGAVVTEVVGVAAGQSCAVEVVLAAGTYAVTSDLNPGSDTTFVVGA